MGGGGWVGRVLEGTPTAGRTIGEEASIKLLPSSGGRERRRVGL